MQPVQKQLSALRLSQQVLIILIFSLVTIVIWIGLSIFSSQKKTAISAESQSLATPLNPSLNLQVLDQIEQKRVYTPNELADFPIYLLILEADKQRLSQNRQSPDEPPASTSASTNLNSLLPTVTVDPPAETTSEQGTTDTSTTQTQTNSEESNTTQSTETSDLL